MGILKDVIFVVILLPEIFQFRIRWCSFIALSTDLGQLGNNNLMFSTHRHINNS